MNMNNCSVHVDSGKQTNTIYKKYVRKEQVRPSSSTLCVIDSTPLKTLRVVDLPVSNPKSNKVMHITFAVVCNELQSLLGLQKMNLITVNDEMFIWMVDTTSDLGYLGKASVMVDFEVQPKTLPCRKLPIAIKDRVKTELDKLVERGSVFQ